MSKKAFIALPLRYRHDSFTGEALNLAVLVIDPEAKKASLARVKQTDRITKAFPGSAEVGFKSLLSRMVEEVERLSDGSLFAKWESPTEVARSLMADPEGCLVWGEKIPVVGESLEDAERVLRMRLLDRHARTQSDPRTDDEVLKTFEVKARERKLLEHLQKVQITDGDAVLKVDRAYQNGRLHCIIPLSFDVASRDYITEKASNAAGKILAVQQSQTRFKPYFLLGAPTDKAKARYLQSAEKTLLRAPCDPEVIREEDSDRLVATFAGMIPRAG